MSWIGGSIVLNDFSEKSIKSAKASIRYAVRSQANLEEFPHMGERLNPIKEYAKSQVFRCYEEAEEYIRQNCQLRDYSAVVKFYEQSEVTGNQKLQTLTTRLEAEKEKLKGYVEKHHVAHFQSDFIGCKACGSKIRKTYVSESDKCPVCKSSLLSKSTLETIARYQEKILDLTKRVTKEQSRVQSKCSVKYLLMYQEYIG